MTRKFLCLWLEIIDIASMEGSAPNINTVTGYCNALKKIFVIDDVAAWNPNLRSKTAIRTSDTRYFVDPSIAVAALETSPNQHSIWY